MKVVVTGANGFLGSWLTKELSKEGYDVHILVRPTSDLSDLEGAKYKTLIGDVTDPQSLEKAFEGARGVFHLAGVVAYQHKDRPLMERVNVLGTENVLQAVEKMKVPKILHLSSVVAIGASKKPNSILNENSEYTIQNLNLGYFETKRKAEILVKEHTKKGLFESIIVNPSTVYGAADAKKGSRSVQVKVAQGHFPFYTPGGPNVVAVEDVIDGIMKAWAKGRSGERYILSGENWTVKQLFTEIASAAGVEPPKYLLPSSVLHTIGFLGDILRPLGIKGPITRENAWTSTMFHWFDNSKAKRELGFNPRPARIAIHNSVEWMKQHGLLNKK
jgi:dihydroflavonol-4-reductase